MRLQLLIPTMGNLNIVGQAVVTSIGNGCNVCTTLSCLLFSFLLVTELGHCLILGQGITEDISSKSLGYGSYGPPQRAVEDVCVCGVWVRVWDQRNRLTGQLIFFWGDWRCTNASCWFICNVDVSPGFTSWVLGFWYNNIKMLTLWAVLGI